MNTRNQRVGSDYYDVRPMTYFTLERNVEIEILYKVTPICGFYDSQSQ